MNFKNSPQIPQKGSSLYLSRQSSNSDSRANPQKNVEPPSPLMVGCCGGFTNVKTTGSSASKSQHLHQLQCQKLEVKVADLEREVQKQTELGVRYRKRMEKTQEYLRYCLQIAQKNGILDLIINYKAELQQSPLSLSSITSPQIPITPSHNHHPNLAAIIDQAKLNGWYIDPTEIELEEKIGEGSTADIYRGTWRGIEVAVKCISREFFRTNQNGVVYFSQELETLSRQRHRFVLQLMGACLDPPHRAWVVTEYLHTTLKEWLHGPGNRRRERMVPLPPFKYRLMRALEIAQAMQYLHEQKPKVIHRDLKPTNIFLDDAMHIRVADFGHARFLDDEEMALTGETGTYVYMAPEVIRCEPYNEKCDVYSFGVILNELVTGNYPYVETEYGPTKIAMEVVEGKLRPQLPCGDVGQLGVLIHLICLCWDTNPSTRPSFAIITSTLKSYANKMLL
ncbi:serine/threonine-protein kinase HT1-like [Abrus precatorius]|uniref:Serine/threonine-protein kinase HT1-like n=1 Tax=Abrus precatorius TaxID=3816 RepID=A0A8B8JQP4_ABRPR|nr:serine/threonine-protein kinase HT1-like [Abrus precatorius]